MLMPVLLATLTALTPLARDTVFPVQRGDRLDIDNHRGDVVIDTWDRDAVRVRSDLDRRQTLAVTRTGAVVRIRPRSAMGGPADADLRITVPRWIDLRVTGNQLDVRVHGTAGEISVETVGGDVDIQGGAGLLSLRTIQGAIRVRDAQGRVEATSVNDDIELIRVRGDVRVETTNGDIALRDARSTNARATTVNGDIVYDGSLQDNGRYSLSTHNGSVYLTVPREANATVSVATYHGEFESDFPVRLTGTTRDRQFNFTLGSGSARVELESFNGGIRLRRP